MGQFSNEGLESWVVKRMLNFLNRAQTPADISEGAVMDDPFEGPAELGYVIGDVVAQRILDRRDELPGKKFTEITQLNDISGLGEDKFNDLVYTFSMSAAETFKRSMYRTVLFDNWDLQYDSVRFENQADFSGDCERRMQISGMGSQKEWVKFANGITAITALEFSPQEPSMQNRSKCMKAVIWAPTHWQCGFIPLIWTIGSLLNKFKNKPNPTWIFSSKVPIKPNSGFSKVSKTAWFWLKPSPWSIFR